MKKAKIILSVLAILVAFGGILAFKATRSNYTATLALTSVSSFVSGGVLYSTNMKQCIHLGIFETNMGVQAVNTFTTDGVVQGFVTFRGSNGVSMTKSTYICNAIQTFTTNMP